MKKILIINGVNLDMLGTREKNIYGQETLESINKNLLKSTKDLDVELSFFQSNIEGEIVNCIHSAKVDGIVINAGAFTHYSYALADALSCIACDKIEVHISNVFTREEFRHKSVLSPYVKGVICGLGEDVYYLAVSHLARH